MGDGEGGFEKCVREWEGHSTNAQCTVAGAAATTAAAAGAIFTAGWGSPFYRVHVAATSIMFK